MAFATPSIHGKGDGSMNATDTLLSVENLSVSFQATLGTVKAVRGVSFHINRGEIVGIVGESGCGKSVTAHTIMGLISRPPASVENGAIRLDGEDLLTKDDRAMEEIRGRRIGMIFQDPMSSLNPTMRIGTQLTEAILRHRRMSKQEAIAHATALLESVGIPQASDRLRQYPHEFSGGMRQRVMIAIALACDPDLIIADEPTTALDVTIQAQILELLKKLSEERGMAVLLITHDLGVVAGLCDRVLVMYAGEIVETGTTDRIFYSPQHPYTKALLEAVPRLGKSHQRRLASIVGAPPDLLDPPKGCAFTDRCPWAMRVCQTYHPVLLSIGEEQTAACWLHHPNAEAQV